MVWVHGRSSETKTLLMPVVDAIKAARRTNPPALGGTPDFTVALHHHAHMELSLAAFRATADRAGTSDALLATLEPLELKVPLLAADRPGASRGPRQGL